MPVLCKLRVHVIFGVYLETFLIIILEKGIPAVLFLKSRHSFFQGYPVFARHLLKEPD